MGDAQPQLPRGRASSLWVRLFETKPPKSSRWEADKAARSGLDSDTSRKKSQTQGLDLSLYCTGFSELPVQVCLLLCLTVTLS